MSRIVLLGHSGYIGSRLAATLERAGEAVVGLSAPDLDLRRSESAVALGDLLDRDDTLVVLSAIKKQLGDNVDVLAQNLAIAMNVGKATVLKPPRRVVFFSSAAV